MAEPGDPHQPDPEPVVVPEPEPPAAPRVDEDATAVADPDPVPEPELEPEPEAVSPVAALHDEDAHVGFASAASLAGRSRPAEPEPEPEPEPDLVVEPEPEPVVVAPAVDAGSTFALSRPVVRRRRAPVAVEGGTGLFTVYALILFAVPTFGVSALIGLLAVTGRSLPDDAVARSHAIYQQRTLWAAAVIALLGAILIVVGVGVFILFALAIWVPVRGAAGVWRLKAGEAIPHPRSWLI